MDFTFVIVGRASDVSSVCETVEQSLLAADFSRAPEVLVSGVAPDGTSLEEALVVRDLVEDKERLQPWQSVYMDFRSELLSLGIQFESTRPDTVTGYVFVPMNKLRSLHRNEMPVLFYDVISQIAKSADALGGYGGFEASLGDVPPEDVLNALLANAEDRSRWFDIHFVETSLLARTNAARAWQNEFARVDSGRFAFFVRADFLEMCSDTRNVV